MLAFNDRAADQLGYSRSEFERLRLADIDAQRDPNEVKARIASVLTEGEARFPTRARTKAGALRNMLVSSSPVEIEGQKRLLSVLQDETERLEVTEALRESEELFRAAFETSPDSINLNRLRDGIYVAVNQGFTRILGWTKAEVVGRSSLSLQIWKDPADRARLVEQLTANGFVENFEAEFRAKDGRVLFGLMSARLLWVRGEQLLLNITRDISSWKRAEAERTSLQNRLQEAAKLEAIGQLAGGVAHDFNNLLTIILSCAEAALSDLEEGNPPSAAELEEISAAGLRARDLTRQLLAVARRQVISPVAMELNTVVSGCERLLRRLLGEGIELAVTCQPDLWPVRCDPGQLEQIIMNLAVNARDAMPDGGRISIETSNLTEEEPESPAKPKAAPRELVRLLVKDTGTGMSAAVKERIFEPFFTTKGPGRGSGLGLATVYGIVKQSGGSIRVETVEGKGTVFDVRFPRTHQPIDQGPPSPSPTRRSGTERVLLVEDDDGVREVTTRALRDGGYDVRVAESATRAIEMAKAGARFDLLVTDVVMPQIDGRTVAAALRERIPGLRVLFISGHAERVLTHGGILEPGIEFLSKPFTPSSLLTKVREMLDVQPST